jgi:CHAT domain-containing protein
MMCRLSHYLFAVAGTLTVCAIGAQQAPPPALMEAWNKIFTQGLSNLQISEQCPRLLTQAKALLPPENSARVRIALDCANNERLIGHADKTLRELDALKEYVSKLTDQPALIVLAKQYRASALHATNHLFDAVQEMEGALELIQQSKENIPKALNHNVSTDLCNLYIATNRLDDALVLCANVVQQRKDIPAGDPIRSRALYSTAVALLQRNNPGDARKALSSLGRGIQDVITTLGPNHLSTLKFRRLYGDALLRVHQYEAAEHEIRSVIAALNGLTPTNAQELTNANDVLRNILLIQNKREEATTLTNRTNSASNSSPILQLMKQLEVASRLMDEHKETEAIDAFRLWLSKAEDMRSSLPADPTLRAQFTQQWVRGYQLFSLALQRQHQPSAALLTIEMSKSRALLHAMEQMDALKTLPNDQKNDALNLMRINAHQIQEASLAQPGSATALKAHRLANQTEKQLRDLVSPQIRNNFSVAASAQQIEQDIHTLSSNMHDDEAVLSLSYYKFASKGSEGFMPLLMRYGKVYSPRSPAIDIPNLNSTITALRMLAQYGSQGLKKRSLKIIAVQPEGYEIVSLSHPTPEEKSPRRVASYLSNKLITPLQEQLKGINRLIVSADGMAWKIPFDLLELNGEPLFRHVIISMTPSLPTLVRQRARLQSRPLDQANARLLALGGANYEYRVRARPKSKVFIERIETPTKFSNYELAALNDAQSPKEFLGTLEGIHSGLKDLPGSSDEVHRISKHFNPEHVTTLTGTQATEMQIDQMARSNLLAEYDYIHFAVHGIAQPKRPLMSALVTGIEDRTETYDGYITAQEIASWNLNAQMVILSACDSAMGKAVDGEGILGLPYAFLTAGAAATVQTLWPIPDLLTPIWIDNLYGRLLKGERPSDALTHVKRDAASKDHWEPLYEEPTPWAAFAIYGW